MTQAKMRTLLLLGLLATAGSPGAAQAPDCRRDTAAAVHGDDGQQRQERREWNSVSGAGVDVTLASRYHDAGGGRACRHDAVAQPRVAGRDTAGEAARY